MQVSFESFGWILLNLEFICIMGTVLSYLGNWGKRMNFGNSVAEILIKVWERKRKSEREKILNFSNVITEIPAAQTCWPSRCEVLEVGCPKETNCGNAIAKLGGGGGICGNCGNAIAENGRKKKVVAETWWGIKKKSATSTIFLQHFHNKSHVISYY